MSITPTKHQSSINLDRFNERLEKQEKSSDKKLLESESLRNFLNDSVQFLKNDSNYIHAENIAHYLMGKVDYLPENFVSQKPDLSNEIRSLLNDLLRTHRFGFFGITETSEKTITKLETLLAKINESLDFDDEADPQSAGLQATQDLMTTEKNTLQQSVPQQSVPQQSVPQQSVPQQSVPQQFVLNDKSLSPAQTPINIKYRQYQTEEINQWLFCRKPGGELGLPISKLTGRNSDIYAPKTTFDSVPMLGSGKFSSRIGIYNGGITDLRAQDGQIAAVGDSNNGDLLTGCGYAVAKAIVNATGAGLQTELYNNYGVPVDDKGKPAVMITTDYGNEHYHQYEGRGFSLTCGSYDMKKSHGIDSVELMTVPLHSEEGVINMYLEALIHSKDKDFIALPMAGMTHDVINNDATTSARLTFAAVQQFTERYPDSKLKIIFTIWQNPDAVSIYQENTMKLDMAS